jgi:hypothetical protein
MIGIIIPNRPVIDPPAYKLFQFFKPLLLLKGQKAKVTSYSPKQNSSLPRE